MSPILLTVIIILLIHSLIGTILYIATNENDEVITYYGIGVIGCVLASFFAIGRRISKWWKYHDKRSIFEDEDGNKFYCNPKYAKDFEWHYANELVKRYATKDEWKDLKPATKEQIGTAQKNCDNCKHDGRCTFDMYRASLDRIRCKHDMFGVVTEFDKFEKK